MTSATMGQLFKLSPYFIQNGYPEVINIIDQLPKHPTLRYRKRSIEGIDKYILHHAASDHPILQQALYHINGRGWPGIGYCIMIANDKIYQVNYLDTESYHCSGQNEHSVGVCILGDLSKRLITQREKELLTSVLVSLNDQLGKKEVYPHKAFAATACPCTPIEPVREDVFHIEQEIEMMNSPEKQEELAFRIANTNLYYYNMAKGKMSDGTAATEGQIKWARAQLLKLEPEMRKLGMLK